MMNKKIDGIYCKVTNCEYHDMNDNCCAGSIVVGPHSASDHKDTCCDTFKCKDCK